ncbi:oligosaccharide flippase family protein [Aurantiacibacter zhengii]|nr:oligosaccharide flippase family protein [Aurantiacibacter zhengii]
MSIRRDAFWSATDTLITSGLAFGLRLIVARLLAPEDFGIAMIAVTVIGLLQAVNDFGLTAALIQKDEEEVTASLIDTTFTASLIITVLLALATAALIAPFAASAYGEPSLQPLILVLGLTLLPSPFSTVVSALMFRRGRFRANAVIKVIANLLGMMTAIVLVMINPSPWVIVAQVLASSLAAAVMLQIANPHRYRLRLSKEHLGSVFGFSTFILLSDLLSFAQSNAGVFILGLVLSTASVGYFALATYLTNTARKIVMSILNRVTFVHFSRNKHDQGFLRKKFISTVRWNCRALFPPLTAMMLFGPSWAPQFMGEEWSALGSLLFWLSLTVIVGTSGGTTSNLYKSMGRPGLDLTFAVVTTAGLLFPGVYVAAQIYGLEGAAIATFVVKVLAVAIRLFALRKLVPGAASGAILASLFQALLQTPVVLAWAASTMLGITEWYLQLPFIVVAFLIYGSYELPRAFPDLLPKLLRRFRERKI